MERSLLLLCCMLIAAGSLACARPLRGSASIVGIRDRIAEFPRASAAARAARRLGGSVERSAGAALPGASAAASPTATPEAGSTAGTTGTTGTALPQAASSMGRTYGAAAAPPAAASRDYERAPASGSAAASDPARPAPAAPPVTQRLRSHVAIPAALVVVATILVSKRLW
jgi:hypothetical protein